MSTGQPALLAGMLSGSAASLQHDVKQAKYPKSADGAAASPGIRAHSPSRQDGTTSRLSEVSGQAGCIDVGSGQSTEEYAQPMLQHNGPTAQFFTGSAAHGCPAVPVDDCAVGPLC